jgi:hypothetical protein
MLEKMNPFGNKPKKAKGGDDTYAHDIAEFNNIFTQVKAVDAAINDYEKKIKGREFVTDLVVAYVLDLPISLNKLSTSIEGFYTSNQQFGSAFVTASSSVSGACEVFIVRIIG